MCFLREGKAEQLKRERKITFYPEFRIKDLSFPNHGYCRCKPWKLENSWYMKVYSSYWMLCIVCFSLFSAGIGRTGIFLALDILMQGLVYDETTVDVYGTVSSLRKQRCCMVQTVVCIQIEIKLSV